MTTILNHSSKFIVAAVFAILATSLFATVIGVSAGQAGWVA